MQARTVAPVLPLYPEHRPALGDLANQARRQAPVDLANQPALAVLEALSPLSLRSILGILADLEPLFPPVVLAGQPVLRKIDTNRYKIPRFIEMIGRLYTRGGAYQGNRDLLSVPSVARCSRHPCRLSDPRTRSYPLILPGLDNLCHLSLQPGRVARSHHPNLYRLFHREFRLFRSVLYQARIITISSNLYSNDAILSILRAIVIGIFSLFTRESRFSLLPYGAGWSS